jgi:6-phosphogluconolactonase/glucosamine-6-phosphate isomerase/deaminase
VARGDNKNRKELMLFPANIQMAEGNSLLIVIILSVGREGHSAENFSGLG